MQSVLRWLKNTLTAAASGRYWHRFLLESPPERDAAIVDLKALASAAHDDAKRRLVAAFEGSLDPLGNTASAANTIAGEYPAALSLQTLMGYFGELLAGICAESFNPFDRGPWKVPAYLFRFHIVAFQELERIRQGLPGLPALPGRTGDDCLAFVRGEEGHIIATLMCEAKCTQGHDAGMISEAHVKVSDALRTPVDLPQLITILRERPDQESRSWANALTALLMSGPSEQHEAFSSVLYICGRRPVKRPSWMPTDKPHQAYTGTRRLESVEVHLKDVEDLVRAVYGA